MSATPLPEPPPNEVWVGIEELQDGMVEMLLGFATTYPKAAVWLNGKCIHIAEGEDGKPISTATVADGGEAASPKS